MSTQRTHIASIMRTGFERLQPATPIREAVARLASAVPPPRPSSTRMDGWSASSRRRTASVRCLAQAIMNNGTARWKLHVPQRLYAARDLDFVSAAEAFLARSHRVYPVMRDVEIVGLLHRSDLFAALVELSGSALNRLPAK